MIQWLRSLVFVLQIYVMMPIIGLLGFPFAIFSKRAARLTCKSYSAWVFATMRWMVGIRYEIRGTPPDYECVVASKHQSFLDIMMIFHRLPRAKFIMKKEILITPVIGQYAARIGCVPVDRGKRGAAIEKMVRDVENGAQEAGQLIIYPQGTRVPPGAHLPYKVGTHVLYEQLGQPCVPVATNVGVLWPRKGIWRKPGLAVVEFLEPIEPGLDKETFMALLEERIETASTRLMKEIGFDAENHKS
ncbi:lysophospholipid acyltransferase family protein [Roseobacteraceae bacterium S113]